MLQVVLVSVLCGGFWVVGLWVGWLFGVGSVGNFVMGYGGVWCFPGGFGCWVLLAVCWFRVMMLCILVCDLFCVFLV